MIAEIILKDNKMIVKFNKQEFRKTALKKLRSQKLFKAKCTHYPLLKRLEELIKFKKAKKILLYMPLFYEADVYKIRRKFPKCDIFVPFMVDISLKMVRLRMPFKIKKFNLREPVASKLVKDRIDMAVVPAIGVDGAMRRVGHGKGFYDRFFDSLSYRPKTIVFIEILDFYTDKILSDKHDVCGDIYLTPSKNYIKRGKNDRGFNRLRSRCDGCWRRVSVRKKDK